VTPQGWDYNTSTAGSKYYYFDVPSGSALSELSAMLTWHETITNTGSSSAFIPSASLTNLDLKLYSASGFTLGSMLDSSVSTVDNIQHTYFSSNTTSLRAGRYALEVSSPSAGTNYGLAWLSNSFRLGDMNGDGYVDGDDIAGFVLGMTNPAAYLAMYPTLTNYVARGDINGDGYYDGDDIAGFVALLVSGGSPAVAVPEPSTVVLMALGTLGIVASRVRRLRRR
jgi:hypothetical protein